MSLMAHEFESGFFGGNVPAWHRLGTVIEEQGVTAARAIQLAGLDWKVELEQLQHQGVDIPNTGVTFRRRKQRPIAAGHEMDPAIDPLGVVSMGYKPVQNQRLFEFGDAIVNAVGGAHWHTAGSLKGGRNVWGLIDLGLTDVAQDEQLQRYVALLNSHDGSSSVHAIVTTVRIVCQNTWTWALNGAPRKIAIRHTGDLEVKLDEAQRVLGLATQRVEAEVTEAQSLLSMPFSGNDYAEMLKVIVPIDEDEMTPMQIAGRKKKREQLWMGYKVSDNLENIRTTRYGALQAVVEVNDHVLRSSNEERNLLRVFGGTELVEDAHQYLLGV